MSLTKGIIAREPAQDHNVNWSLEDVEVQLPGEDEVLVEVRASGICHTDIVMSSVPEGVMGIKYPRIVGHEGMPGLGYEEWLMLIFARCRNCTQRRSKCAVRPSRRSSLVVFLLLFVLFAMSELSSCLLRCLCEGELRWASAAEYSLP